MPLPMTIGCIAIIAVGVGIILFVLLHAPERPAEVGEKPYASLHHPEDEEEPDEGPADELVEDVPATPPTEDETPAAETGTEEENV